MGIVFPRGDYQRDTRVAAAELLPDGHDWIEISAEHNEWRGALEDVIRVRADVSFDGGSTWRLLGQFTATAEIAEDPRLGVHIPARADRRIRITFETLRELRTEVAWNSEDRGIALHSGRAPASVAFDAVSSVDFANVSSASWTHTPSGTPTGVGIGISQASVVVVSVTAVTYDGEACAEVVTKTEDTGIRKRASIWGLASPPAGAVTVALTLSSGSYGGAGAITVVGGDATTLSSNTATGELVDSDGTLTCTCVSAVDELVMDVVAGFRAGGGPLLSVGADQTERWNRVASGSNTRTAGSTEGGAASVTMSWTVTGTSSNSVIAAMSFLAAAAGGTTPKGPLGHPLHGPFGGPV